MEILQELEGKDIHIGSYDAGGQHYRVDNLKLLKFELDRYPPGKYSKGYIPSVIVLWGSRRAALCLA